MHSDKVFLNVTRLATILAFLVIVLGAYVRLSDAGLGCPDWPGCYGQLVVPGNADTLRSIEQAYPERPLHHAKAWKEMAHRYAAGILGLLILTLTVMAWNRRSIPAQPVIIPMILLALVIFQSLLGMWTVTLLLKPIVVMGHLLGGMSILALLFWLLLRQSSLIGRSSRKLFPWVVAGLLVVIAQISLGGWTSANYSALVCPDFPTCQGQWWPDMDFAEGFTLWRGLGVDYEGGVLVGNARTAIHVSHRIGAIMVLLVIGAVAIRAICDNSRAISRAGMVLISVLIIQLGLGISNVIKQLPLSVAVAHNGVAALLLLSLVALLHYSVPQNGDPGSGSGDN